MTKTIKKIDVDKRYLEAFKNALTERYKEGMYSFNRHSHLDPEIDYWSFCRFRKKQWRPQRKRDSND